MVLVLAGIFSQVYHFATYVSFLKFSGNLRHFVQAFFIFGQYNHYVVASFVSRNPAFTDKTYCKPGIEKVNPPMVRGEKRHEPKRQDMCMGKFSLTLLSYLI